MSVRTCKILEITNVVLALVTVLLIADYPHWAAGVIIVNITVLLVKVSFFGLK